MLHNMYDKLAVTMRLLRDEIPEDELYAKNAAAQPELPCLKCGAGIQRQ